MGEDLRRFLSRIGLFDDLSDDARDSLARRGSTLCFQRGEIICSQGDAGAALFVVVSGMTQVSVHNLGENTILAHLGSGDYFGEMSLLSGLTRTATVRALSPTTLFALTREDFIAACREHVDIALELIRTLSLRLARSNVRTGPARQARVIAFLSMESAIGRSSLACSLALALAGRPGADVVVFDPVLSSVEIANIFGVSNRSHVTRELVGKGTIDLATALDEIRSGLSMIAPSQEDMGFQEHHYYVPFHALRERVSTIVIDSTCTVAGVNRTILRTADSIVFLTSVSSADLEGLRAQIAMRVLGPAGVDPARLIIVRVASDDGIGSPSADEELSCPCLVLPRLDNGFSLADMSSAYREVSERLAVLVSPPQGLSLYMTVSSARAPLVTESLVKALRQLDIELVECGRVDSVPGCSDAEEVVHTIYHFELSFEEPLSPPQFAIVIDSCLRFKEEEQIEQVYVKHGSGLDVL